MKYNCSDYVSFSNPERSDVLQNSFFFISKHLNLILHLIDDSFGDRVCDDRNLREHIAPMLELMKKQTQCSVSWQTEMEFQPCEGKFSSCASTDWNNWLMTAAEESVSLYLKL